MWNRYTNNEVPESHEKRRIIEDSFWNMDCDMINFLMNLSSDTSEDEFVRVSIFEYLSDYPIFDCINMLSFSKILEKVCNDKNDSHLVRQFASECIYIFTSTEIYIEGLEDIILNDEDLAYNILVPILIPILIPIQRSGPINKNWNLLINRVMRRSNDKKIIDVCKEILAKV